jgi:hypothetical protein
MSKSNVGRVVTATLPLEVTYLAQASHQAVASGLPGRSTEGAVIPLLTAPREEPA